VVCPSGLLNFEMRFLNTVCSIGVFAVAAIHNAETVLCELCVAPTFHDSQSVVACDVQCCILLA
jgi:hypothetical protein